MHPKEKEWILKIQDNDNLAFKELFDFYCESLLEYAFHLVKDKAIAEDIVQHVWIKVWEKRSSLNPELSFRSYLYTGVRNQALKYIRDTKDKFTSLETIYSLADENILQDARFHDKESLQLINKAVDHLPPKCREIFILNHLEGLSYKEITEVLNISINTVKTQMARALRSLRKALKITLLLFYFSRL